tara:strand:+ start:618 stop:932 length:315 start_codon:yes stop_codon:yes gene_type:complete
MKIERKLKYGSFGWNDETKTFTIEYRGKSIELNKVYAFSFLRFAFSVAQRNWFRKLDKPKKKEVICDKSICEKELEQEQYELPTIDGEAISREAKLFADSLIKK